jgi:hypothetical protein
MEKPISGTKWSVLTASIIASMMGSGGGGYAYMQSIGPQQLQTIARPDPATGTQLRSIEGRLKYHLENHPDMIHSFDRRITRLETKLDAKFEMMNEKLDRLSK